MKLDYFVYFFQQSRVEYMVYSVQNENTINDNGQDRLNLNSNTPFLICNDIIKNVN